MVTVTILKSCCAFYFGMATKEYCMLCGKKNDQGNGAWICRKCGHMPKGKSWGDDF